MKKSIDTIHAYVLNGRTTLFSKLGSIELDYISYKALLNSEMHKMSEYFYKEDGDLIKEVCYNQKYAISEEKHFKKDGVLDFKFIMKYDNNDLLIEKNMILGNGNPYGKWIITYDELKRIKEEVWLNKHGEVEVKDIYTYSEDGRKA